MILLFVDSAVMQKFVVWATLVLIIIGFAYIIALFVHAGMFTKPKTITHPDITVTEQPNPYDPELIADKLVITKIALFGGYGHLRSGKFVNPRTPCYYKIYKTPREIYERYFRHIFV